MYAREIVLVVLGALLSQQFTWSFLSEVYHTYLVLERVDIFISAVLGIVLLFLFCIYLPLNSLAKDSINYHNRYATRSAIGYSRKYSGSKRNFRNGLKDCNLYGES